MSMKPQLGNDTDSTQHEDDWFNANAAKKDIQHFVKSFRGKRTLDLLDLFGASGSVSAIFKNKGQKNCAVYDLKINGATDDICAEEGFYNLLTLACRMKSGGLVMGGPPCSLFVFMSSSIHRRSLDNPWGNTKYASVRLANRIVSNMAVVLDVLMQRDVHIVIEQPSGSAMFRLPPLAAVVAKPGWARVFTYMGAFEHDMLKPTILMGTLPTLHRMKRRRPDPQKFRKIKSTFYVNGKVGKKKTLTGRKALQGSAAYTKCFCRDLHKTWVEAVEGR
ncbi:RHM1 [Symbiodinium natans]|uniref:RHM1 protein n=1 Tax=Symbiodinium natans TaxID=878477 RepID=A0A812RZA9_9DINO|nr:RHM1 [Symbiodinium natans]